jgi:endoglucanase
MDASFKEKLRPYVVRYKEYIEELEKDNPYGVPIGLVIGQEAGPW